jgi:HTH-type transcriptional regulator/antitoxin HipB
MDYPIRTLEQLRPVLQGFRKQAGLSQARIASLLGVTQQSYAKIEANPASTSVERLFTVLRLLGAEITLRQGTQPAEEKVFGTLVADPEQSRDFSQAGPIARAANTLSPRRTPTSVPEEQGPSHSTEKGARKTAPQKLVPPSGKKENW